MKHVHAIVVTSGFALALATAMATDINGANADADIASNSQLKGKYAGINSGACLVALSGFNENDQPIDPTTRRPREILPILPGRNIPLPSP